MKIMHLADLHIGKRVNGFSMVEDQRYALEQILKLIEKERVECLLIAGDVYDTSVPSSESMTIFDGFLTSLNKLQVKVIIISGNHDSQERLSFARRLISNQSIYISGPYEDEVEKITLQDEYGPINFYLLPFIKPIQMKKYKEDLDLSDFQGALSYVISNINPDKSERNIILSHQFIVGAQTSESEELYIGGLEAISYDLYDDFDYVAMGHIHKKQSFRNGKIRYPGSLLKYSKSESNYNKTITIIDFKDKDNIDILEHEISYLRDMRKVEGFFNDIIESAILEEDREDYIHITLYDEDEILDGMNRLRELYPNIMTFTYYNSRTNAVDIEYEQRQVSKDPFELFKDFYELRNNKQLDDRKSKIIQEVINDVWGANNESD